MINKILAAVFTIFVALVGASAQVPDTWKTFTSFEGRFSVALPCTPTTSSEEAKSGTASTHEVYFNCMAGNAVYFMTYADLPGGNSKLVLDHYRDGVTSETPITPGTEKEITLGSYAGREFAIKTGPGNNDLCYTWRIYYINGRIYGLSFATRAFAVDPASAAKFFSSFALEKSK